MSSVFFISDKICIKPCEYGFGVFAKNHIYKNEILESSPCITLDDEELLIGGLLNDYIFDNTLAKKSFLVGLGYSSLYNHSDDPNAGFEVFTYEDEFNNNRQGIRITALKNICKDNQIMIYYGYNV